jgi:replicative DNA helicase
MVHLAATIQLNEVDAELTALGTMFLNPEAFHQVAGEINPAWFSDPLARYVFDHCVSLQAEGHRISTQAIVAALPEDCGGIPRGAFYARACAAGLPLNSLSGLLMTLKDRWARRELIASAEAMKSAAITFGEDPFLIASDAVLSLDTINAAKAGRAVGTLATATASLAGSLKNPAALAGATTGLRSLDRKLNGYRAGQLYVIAGRPGMGKSAFMVSSLRRTAAAGYGVAIFSLEMPAEEVAARAVSDGFDHVMQPGFGAILKGQISEDEKSEVLRQISQLDSIPLHIDDSSRLTFSEIAARARRIKAQLEAEGRFLSVVCIDHMGLVTPSERYRGNKVAEAGEVSGQARALAKDLDCCVVLLCQLSREVEKRDDKRPVMSDLRWSGEIEQDAHVIGFLYREHYYLSQDPNAESWKVQEAKHKIEFLIRKNRNGETADVQLWCSIAHSSVRDE